MKQNSFYVLIILLLCACGQQGDGNRENGSGYETMTVKRSDITLEQTYPASIEGRQSISGVVDRSTGALSARAAFPNPDGRLLSGGTGRLMIPYQLVQAIVIPQAATYEIQDKVYVYKVVDGKAESAIITVLPVSDGHNYVVTDGLEEGETIVAKGANYVREGMAI